MTDHHIIDAWQRAHTDPPENQCICEWCDGWDCNCECHYTPDPAREPVEVRAMDLEPGDTVVADGFIDLRVTDVRNPVHGWTTAAYVIRVENTELAGIRTYASGQSLTVLRSAQEAGH